MTGWSASHSASAPGSSERGGKTGKTLNNSRGRGRGGGENVVVLCLAVHVQVKLKTDCASHLTTFVLGLLCYFPLADSTMMFCISNNIRVLYIHG